MLVEHPVLQDDLEHLVRRHPLPHPFQRAGTDVRTASAADAAGAVKDVPSLLRQAVAVLRADLRALSAADAASGAVGDLRSGLEPLGVVAPQAAQRTAL